MRHPPTVENETTRPPLSFVQGEPVLGSDQFSIFFGSAKLRSRATVIGHVVVMTLGGGEGVKEEDPIC